MFFEILTSALDEQPFTLSAEASVSTQIASPKSVGLGEMDTACLAQQTEVVLLRTERPLTLPVPPHPQMHIPVTRTLSPGMTWRRRLRTHASLSPSLAKFIYPKLALDTNRLSNDLVSRDGQEFAWVCVGEATLQSTRPNAVALTLGGSNSRDLSVRDPSNPESLDQDPCVTPDVICRHLSTHQRKGAENIALHSDAHP